MEYFGAPGVPDALEEVPLEYFARARDWLLDRPGVRASPVGVVGFSRGGEGALLVGSHLDGFGAVVAYVPSGYAFPAPTWMPGIEEEGPAWTVRGEPVPYVPVDQFVESDPTGMDESLSNDDQDGEESTSEGAVERACEERLARATIPVERIDGPVLLVSGDRDAVWPSSGLAAVAADRLVAHDHPWPVDHRRYPDAGHATRVPYRHADGQDPDDEHRFGGTHAANARAAADAWPAALSCLRFGLRDRDQATSITW